MKFTRRITIIDIKRPQSNDINQDLQNFGSSLGLFGLRDKDKSCYRVFLELLKMSKRGEGISSDELAAKLNLTRGTVVYHLNKLMETGIAVHVRGLYYLRENKLQEVVHEMKKDLEESMADLMSMAKEIDEWMGM